MNRSYPKRVLNIAYINIVWTDRVTKWKKEAHVEEMGLDCDYEPYYVPDFTLESGSFEMSVYDKTHLGSNLRKALCLDKIQGISK